MSWNWYRRFLGVRLIQRFCKQISRSLMWPQHKMSVLALKADSLMGTRSTEFPPHSCWREHSTPARGYHVFEGLSWLLSFSRGECPREYFILHVVLKLQALQSSGKNMLCVSESLDARKISVIIKITQWFFLSTSLWNSLDHSLIRSPMGVSLDFNFYLWV